MILQYDSEDCIDEDKDNEDPEVTVPLLAKATASLKILKRFLTECENQEKKNK